MGKQYDHISLEERCDIARLQSQGFTLRQIAAALDRAPSTITRELRRNGCSKRVYKPVYADQQHRARRWSGSKLDRDPILRALVLERLAGGWSPEQVAGRVARDHGGARVVSHETIYRFIYAQIARTKDYSWRQYLPRGKWKRGWRGRKGGSAALHIAQRRPLAERPAAANDRRTPGHWEADLMRFRTSGQAILVLHERSSRLLLAVRVPDKNADHIVAAIAGLLAPLPVSWRRTVTFDNGTEFAYHYRLHDLKLQTFFCDPHAPWQKGGIENGIGRMRRVLPRKTDLPAVPEQRIREYLLAYGNTPRKCLGFQTPLEIVRKKLLHFKCEFTLPPSREWLLGRYARFWTKGSFCERLKGRFCS